MSNNQFIDLQDGHMAIGLALQENYTLLLEVRHFHSGHVNEEKTGTIISISDGMLYTTLGPFDRYVRELNNTWQSMDVPQHEEREH